MFLLRSLTEQEENTHTHTVSDGEERRSYFQSMYFMPGFKFAALSQIIDL